MHLLIARNVWNTRIQSPQIMSVQKTRLEIALLKTFFLDDH